MTIGAIMHPHEHEEIIPEGKRLRMKDWLKIRIGDPRYPGLVWLDKEQQVFKIPWKHAALHGWDKNSDGALFRDWAEHTGSCVKNAHQKTLKATFRCALHSLPDVHEDRMLAKKRGDDACRVFRFSTATSSVPRKRHIRIRNHKKSHVKNLTAKQIHEATKAMNTPPMNFQPSQYEWNYQSRNHSVSSIPNSAFSPPQVPSNEFTNYHHQPQNSWVLQGNCPSFPSISSPALRAPTPVSMSPGYEETFKPMHHSLSDPDIGLYYQNDNNAMYPRGPVVSRSQITGDAITPKIQFHESTFLQLTGQQDPVSPASTCMSDPRTSPYPVPEVHEFYGQSNSPSSVYSSSFNNQSKESFYQPTQNGTPSPLNSNYLSNPSPAPSVISRCPSRSHVGADFLSTPHQQTTVLTECQNQQSPYCHSTELHPVSVQQAINEFDFVSSTPVQPNVDHTIPTKEMGASNETVLTWKSSQLKATDELLTCDSITKQDNLHFIFPISYFGNNSPLGFDESSVGVMQHTKLPAIETLSSH